MRSRPADTGVVIAEKWLLTNDGAKRVKTKLRVGKSIDVTSRRFAAKGQSRTPWSCNSRHAPTRRFLLDGLESDGQCDFNALVAFAFAANLECANARDFAEVASGGAAHRAQ